MNVNDQHFALLCYTTFSGYNQQNGSNFCSSLTLCVISEEEIRNGSYKTVIGKIIHKIKIKKEFNEKLIGQHLRYNNCHYFYNTLNIETQETFQ